MAKRKKKTENKKILALEVYNHIFSTDPSFADEIGKVLDGYKSAGNTWNEELIYCPIKAIIEEKAKQIGENQDIRRIIRRCPASVISAMAAWDLSKVIYRFDQDFFSELRETEGLEKVSVDSLLHLPYKCICLQIGDESRLVFLDYDAGLEAYELRIETLNYDDEENSIDEENNFLILTADNLQKCIDDSIKASIRDFKIPIPESKMNELVKQIFDIKREVFQSTIQAILFIQSQNADVVEDEKNAEARAKYNRNRTGAKRIPKVLDAGYRVGSEIRKIKRINIYKNDSESTKETHEQTINTESSSASSKKTPHVRRAHWHHFWIGSEKAGNRELVVRWLPPMAIGNRSEGLTSVVHDVRTEL